MACEFDEERYVVDMHSRGVLGIDPDYPISLKSNRLSPHYHNQRGILSINRLLNDEGIMSNGRQLAFVRNAVAGYVNCLLEVERPFRHVFGKAQGATAFAAIVAYEGGFSYLWERVPDGKTYGKKKPVEGDFLPGDTVHLVDDNTTDGKSKIEGADVLFQVGLKPVSLTVGFDREEGAKATLEGLGYEMNAVTSLSRAVPILRDNNLIGTKEIEAVIEYHEGLRTDGIGTTFAYSS